MSVGAVSGTVSSFQNTLTAEAVSQAVKPPAKFPQVDSIVIRAMLANTGIIYVGNKEEKNEVDATSGFELAKGDAVAMDVNSFGKIFFNGTKTGDKICVICTGP